MHSIQLKRTVFILNSIFSISLPNLADDLLVEDFESGYSAWRITGDAFGDSPADGTLSHQMAVDGFLGNQLVNTFKDGDQSVGTALSEPFKIERNHLSFLIGGGHDLKTVGIELLVQNEVVRAATGSDSETLEWSSWNVSNFLGKSAQLRIYDRATGGWGHINVDHILQTNSPRHRFNLSEKLAAYRSTANHLDEPFRPQFHFSPEINWMNDPNGLVYHEGEFHLFYQYNPAGNSWGHMSWGHAVSEDLIHWEHLPVAIYEEDGIMAFSGCCVIDHHNSSGFGTNGNPPMVAIYTGHGHGKQVQNLAYSIDHGRTWTKYSQNPVLDIDNKDFRDPKVFYHEPTRRWVMLVSLAVEKVIVFYSSQNLKDWHELSRFGPAGHAAKSNWECPDLFELEVEGAHGEKLWVLEADMGSGSIAGGSGGEYFVGHFDGTKYEPIQAAKWVDFGRDFYAPVSWANIPKEDGRRIWIGWFNNWETCLLPTSPWRSCMSVPRSLSLSKISPDNLSQKSQYVMVQRPVKELKQLRRDTIELDTSKAAWPPVAVTKSGQVADLTFELETILHPGHARSCGFRIRTEESEFLEIGYDRKHAVVYVDRTKSGNVEFHEKFAGRHEAPTRVINGEVKLRVLVDRSSIEVFINDGEAVISDRFFPTNNNPVVEVFCGDQSAKITETWLHRYRSIWNNKLRE